MIAHFRRLITRFMGVSLCGIWSHCIDVIVTSFTGKSRGVQIDVPSGPIRSHLTYRDIGGARGVQIDVIVICKKKPSQSVHAHGGMQNLVWIIMV